MSTPGLGGSRQHLVLGDAGRYLSDTAPGHGGRNTRPLALPALAATYCSSARTGQGVAAAVLGALGGGIAWFALAQLGEPQPSVVLAVVALVLAVAAVAAAAVIGLRVLRQGSSLVAAIRRWHGVAPEVPVAGVDVLTGGAAVTRLVLAGAGVLAGITAVVVAGVAGTPASWVGGCVVAAWLLGTGMIAVGGWWRVRALLSSATPLADHTPFAPAAPVAPGPQQWAPAPQPAADLGGPQWAPPPTPALPPTPPPAPWTPPPPSSAPSATTWQAAPEPSAVPPPAETDLGDTRLAADTTLSGRRERPAVVLDDGSRLSAGLTLLGRAPRPRAGEEGATCTIVLHPSVSKTHASFRVQGDSVHVTDRASTNGTTVVGADGAARRLPPWVEEQLTIGDEVLLGSYRIRVVVA